MAVLKSLLRTRWPLWEKPVAARFCIGELALRNERELALAKTTLAIMAECNVSPVPENFELFYHYAAGENPAVGRIIGDMIAARRPFTVSLLQDLRDRCFARDRTERAVNAIGDGVSASLNEVLEKLDAASKQAFEYGQTLSAASGELGHDRTPDDLRRLVGGLISATKVMEERSKSLEGELQNSSQQVSELKSQLDNVRKEALTDPLTGIANRKAFDTNLQAAIEDAQSSGAALSLVHVRYRSLQTVQRHMGAPDRRPGTAPRRELPVREHQGLRHGRPLWRRGVRRHCPPRQRGRRGEACRSDSRSSVQGKRLIKKSTGDILGSITISIGVAELAEGETAASLIQRADTCLYRAKHAGRNCVIGDNDPRAVEMEIDAA